MSKHDYYKDKLQAVTNYLRSSDVSTITIEKLEKASHFSYRNLQRIFKAYYNETIGAYISRIKIERAAKLLLFSNKAIKDIAYEVGYSDLQALSKAFKKQFGISPSKYRAQKEELLKSTEKENNMSFHHTRIELLEAKTVFYSTYKGDYYNNGIDNVWNTLEQEANNIKLNTIESFGVIWDEPTITETIKCYYDACFVIPENEKALIKRNRIKTIPPQKYAVFLHLGNYKTLEHTYDSIFGQWLFKTDYELSEAPFLEFYKKHNGNTTNENDYETEIYIPLKS